MLKLYDAIKENITSDTDYSKKAKDRFLTIAKPIDGLGKLEKEFIKIVSILKNDNIKFKKAIVIACSDNGVTKQNVTQTNSSVTKIVAEQMLKENTTICKMAEIAKADIFVIDVGMNEDIEGGENFKNSYGTEDISIHPAMSSEHLIDIIEKGINYVKTLKDSGYNIIVTGEMGIGNTTTSSAVTAVLLDCPVEDITSRGAGLSKDGLNRKIEVIKKAIDINKPDKNDVIDVVSKLGGFDIAFITGLYIGGRYFGIPVVCDGFICLASALCAELLWKGTKDFIIPSHISKEKGSLLLCKYLNFEPIIHGDFSLGEATGGVCILPMLDMIENIYNTMPQFKDFNMKAYEEFKD